VRRLESEFFSLLQTAATDKLLRSLDTFAQPIMLCDMGARGWPILHANAGWVKRLGGQVLHLHHFRVILSVLSR
jgi:hypothetical protein